MAMAKELTMVSKKKLGVIGASFALVAGSFSSMTPANAAVCGYYQDWESYEGIISFQVALGPFSFDVKPFNGERRVSMYNHCTDDGSNVKIRMSTSDGDKEACVKPGVTRLGYVDRDARVKDAYAIGGC